MMNESQRQFMIEPWLASGGTGTAPRSGEGLIGYEPWGQGRYPTEGLIGFEPWLTNKKKPAPQLYGQQAYDPITGLPVNQQQALQSAGLTFDAAPVETPSGLAPTVNPAAGGFQANTPAGYGNYASIIANDPFYQQTLADLSAQGIADQAGADAAMMRALIQFGEVPALEGLDLGLAGKNYAKISESARPLAAANTAEGLSIAARMQKQLNNNIRAIKNALAARGALMSGETGYQLGEEAQRYKQSQYDARTQLVDLLAGINAGLAAAARARAAQQAQAAEGAWGRGALTPPPTAPPPTSAPPEQPPPPTAGGPPRWYEEPFVPNLPTLTGRKVAV